MVLSIVRAIVTQRSVRPLAIESHRPCSGPTTRNIDTSNKEAVWGTRVADRSADSQDLRLQ